jgi:hypothetical protein
MMSEVDSNLSQTKNELPRSKLRGIGKTSYHSVSC